MTTISFPRRSTAIVASLIALVSACGSNKAAPTTTATAAATPSTTPSTSAATTTVAAPPSSASTTTKAGAGAASWPTYHRDLRRTGVEPGATTNGLSAEWSSEELDGNVYAEPLLVGDRVYAATNGDSVYALDASTGKTVWQAHLGDPIPRSMLPCGNVNPTGILSTPVIDTAGGVLYGVAFVQPGRHDLFALDLADGKVRFQRAIDVPGTNPLVHQQRGALAVANGSVYVAFGGLYGDCGAYRGAVVASKLDGTGDLSVFQVRAGREGGIWAPAGPSVDSAGNVFVTTGNQDSPRTYADGDSVLKLSPGLERLDSFTPENWPALSSGDTDLGSLSPALLDNDVAFQIGKEGVGYLVRTGALGGIGGAAFQAPVCDGGFGATAYAPPMVYTSCSDGLFALSVSPAPSFSTAWQSRNFYAGPPIVAFGLVWTVNLDDGELVGLTPDKGEERVRQPIGAAAQFSTPSAGGGRLVVAAEQKVKSFKPS